MLFEFWLKPRPEGALKEQPANCFLCKGNVLDNPHGVDFAVEAEVLPLDEIQPLGAQVVQHLVSPCIVIQHLSRCHTWKDSRGGPKTNAQLRRHVQSQLQHELAVSFAVIRRYVGANQRDHGLGHPQRLKGIRNQIREAFHGLIDHCLLTFLHARDVDQVY